MIKKFSLIFAFLILFAGHAYAEVIALKTGEKVEAKILNHTDDYVEVDINLSFPITYFLDEIDTIDGKPIAEALAQRTTTTPQFKPVLTEPNEKEPVRTAIPNPVVQVIPASPEPTVKAPPTTPPAPNSTVANQWTSTPTDNVEKDFMELISETKRSNTKELSTSYGILVLALVIVFYFVLTYPLFVIGKKTDMPNPILAFIPIAQLFLMCKIAGRPGWWVLLFLIPIVSFFITVILWMDITVKRGKPKWMGIFMAIPLINIAYPYYVAFVDE